MICHQSFSLSGIPQVNLVTHSVSLPVSFWLVSQSAVSKTFSQLVNQLVSQLVSKIFSELASQLVSLLVSQLVVS